MDIYYLQERMLSVMERDWATSTPLPENWHTLDAIRPCKDALAELVKKNFFGHPIWAWKDPRTCLLLPLWREVLSDLGVKLKVVFVVRNPLDVARSLEKRNGFSLQKGLGMWFAYSLAALKGVEGLETVFVSYDSFLANWKTELERYARSLGIEWPADESELKEKMASFVRHDLRHSVSGLDELDTAKIPAPIIRLYAHLLDLQLGTVAPDPGIGYMPDGVYREFVGYARMFTDNMDSLPDSSDSKSNTLITNFFSRLKLLMSGCC
jgi:hypothetical protein